MTTISELETALENKGWEPDYRDTNHQGDPLDHPVFEVSINDRIINVELSSTEENEVTFARVWEYSENKVESVIEDVWDIEDVSSVESIIEEVQLFVDYE